MMEPITIVEFGDGACWFVSADAHGKYVIDDEGEQLACWCFWVTRWQRRRAP